MADRTGIEWTDATWNPIRGCSRVSEGCRHCYAEKQAARIVAMDRGRGIPEGSGAYDGLLAKGGQWNGQVNLVESVLDQPLRWRKPRRIFVNSMSDLFHETVPDWIIDRVFAVMALAEEHTFQVLTKRPERMLNYFSTPWRDLRFRWAGALPINFLCDENHDLVNFGDDWPLPNVWLGVSVENQATADQRIPLLLQTPAAVRWISAEPLLGSIQLDWDWLERSDPNCDLGFQQGDKLDKGYCGRCYGHVDDPIHVSPHRILDWVVVGGESGVSARPMHPDWVRSLRDQCQETGVPFLFKQWGAWANQEVASLDLNNCYKVAKMGGWIEPEGSLSTGKEAEPKSQKAVHVFYMSKKSAGRQLDGRLHDEYPEVDRVRC